MRALRSTTSRDAAGVGPLGSEEAIRALYRAHGPELYRFVVRQIHDESRAADVVQEVFLRTWRAAGRFDPEIASVRVWLFAIARNATIDESRRRAARPLQMVPPDDLDQNESTPSGHDAVMNTWLVEEALRRIGEPHRVAVVETYLRGRPYEDVAGELGVPVGTLRTRVFYGLKALRLAMDEMGVEP
ncbi:MAG: sigma-70 family RNA polymerase sigma factor [Ilumatobacteraceae bacterium]